MRGVFLGLAIVVPSITLGITATTTSKKLSLEPGIEHKKADLFSAKVNVAGAQDGPIDDIHAVPPIENPMGMKDEPIGFNAPPPAVKGGDPNGSPKTLNVAGMYDEWRKEFDRWERLNSPFVPPPDPRGIILFRNFVAVDNTYSGIIPAGWKIKSAALEGFHAESPSKERTFFYGLSVAADERSYALNLTGLQMMARMGVVSPKQFNLRARLFSPPLSPVGVIRDFFPNRFSDMVQHVVVQGHEDRPGLLPWAKTARVHYTYLNVQEAPAVPMEGLSTVSTSLFFSGVYNTWRFDISSGCEAPPQLFKENLQLYKYIHHKIKPDIAAIHRRISDMQAALAIHTRTIHQMSEQSRRMHENFTKMMQETLERFMKANSRSAFR